MLALSGIIVLFLSSFTNAKGGRTGGVFDPLTSPYGTKCPSNGKTVSFSSWESSPYDFEPFVYKFQNPVVHQKKAEYCGLRNGQQHCVEGYDIVIKEIKKQICPKSLPATWFLSYDGKIPGPMMPVEKGDESVVRFINKVNNTHFPADEYCKSQGKTGRSFSIHNHGMVSMPAWDGWAEDRNCQNEYKDYIFPNSEAKLYWYHDHSLGITAENAYYGLAGLNYVTHTGEQPSIDEMPKLFWVIKDILLDKDCQLRIEPQKMHDAFFFGDIMTINGIPWPKMTLDPRTYLINVLNPSISRSYLLNIVDDTGAPVHNQICSVVGSDDGYRPFPVQIPPEGLMQSIAERYQLVCDFSKVQGKTLYLMNYVDPKRQKPIPAMFCKSHVIAKIVVGSNAVTFPPFVFRTSVRPENNPTELIDDKTYAKAMALAQQRRPHRVLEFNRRHGKWVINGEGWMDNKFAATNVGRDSWEVWQFKTSGGWWHPIHIHLVNFLCLQRNGGPCESYEIMSSKDVIHLDPGGELYVMARFGPHIGPYMFHCHNLIHEDSDMMRAFNITDQNVKVLNKDYLTTTKQLEYVGAFNDAMGEHPQPISTMPLLNMSYLKKVSDQRYYRVFYPDCNRTSDVKFCKDNPWRVQ